MIHSIRIFRALQKAFQQFPKLFFRRMANTQPKWLLAPNSSPIKLCCKNKKVPQQIKKFVLELFWCEQRDLLLSSLPQNSPLDCFFDFVEHAN